MRIIIDANIIISMLIKPGKPIEIIFRDDLEIFAPKLLLTELENNKEEIISKSRLSKEEIEDFSKIVLQRIKIISENDFIKFRAKAEKICPHMKDVQYFALSLHLQCPIWSNEKKLQEQPHIKVYATHEIMRLFGTA